MVKRYKVEALNEPSGEGNGWEYCAEPEATVWGVAASGKDFDGWEDCADTRDAAQAICDRMNAEQGG